ncbi:MAG: hypothetical protein FH751_15420 [Firmicutes bacterium]|nr:hypothetical protein [Bacillota bacterium]
MSVTTLSGCTYYKNYHKQIYNDTSEIIKQDDIYTYKDRVGETTKREANIEYGTFNGMETIWKFKSEGKGSITIDFNSKLNKGKFKCLLINPKNKVKNIFKQSEEGLINKSNLKINLEKGTYRLKVVGKGAGGEVTLKIKDSENVIITK